MTDTMFQRLALLGYVLLAGIVLFFLSIPVRRARSDRSIKKLGARAAFVQTKWPFGNYFSRVREPSLPTDPT